MPIVSMGAQAIARQKASVGSLQVHNTHQGVMDHGVGTGVGVCYTELNIQQLASHRGWCAQDVLPVSQVYVNVCIKPGVRAMLCGDAAHMTA